MVTYWLKAALPFKSEHAGHLVNRIIARRFSYKDDSEQFWAVAQALRSVEDEEDLEGHFPMYRGGYSPHLYRTGS